jgi:hypothetical protein
MIDFTDEQKMAQKMVRQWAEKELAPLVPRMEKGEILPYEAMRKLIKTFGLDEMVRSLFTKLAEKPQSEDDKQERNLSERASARDSVSPSVPRWVWPAAPSWPRARCSRNSASRCPSSSVTRSDPGA